MTNTFFIACISLLVSCISAAKNLASTTPSPEKEIVIISTSRNNKSFYEKNLNSTLNQNYTHYKIIWIDDASTDGTPELVKKYLAKHDTKNIATFIENKERQGQLANIYQAVHTCSDSAIIIIADGDDWLAHANVLKAINATYQDPEVWLTYGEYASAGWASLHVSFKYPQEVIESNTFRSFKFGAQHLRTFYAWLFKKINKQDLMYNGNFYQYCTDVATMLPLLEMAGTRSRYLQDILLIYNNISPYNGFRNPNNQIKECDVHIRSRKGYQPLTQKPQVHSNPDQKKEAPIINVHYCYQFAGGVETHLAEFTKTFNQHAYCTTLLTSYHSLFLIELLKKSGLLASYHYYLYNHEDLIPRLADFNPITYKMDTKPVIICNWMGLLPLCLQQRSISGSPIIYVQHTNQICTPKDLALLNQVQGIVMINPAEVKTMERHKEQGYLNNSLITHIPPFTNSEPFTNFVARYSKQDFFKQKFNITVQKNDHVISMIANMVAYKNHTLLFKAIALLQRKRVTPFHVILAGSGTLEAEHKNTVAKLGLSDIVHFVGKTTEIPELLYHSTLHVLTSTQEPFGIAHVEGGLMKKPFLAANTTGMEHYINSGVNGLTFEPNDAKDLASKLELLLDNKALRRSMGEQALLTAHKEFSSEVLFNHWKQFITQCV